MVEENYKVRLEMFEGPLDLLLYLVQREEIDIYDISIVRITGQYLEYLQDMERLDLEIAGEFLVMAARLIYLKSRSLLPVDQREEVTEEEDDPRLELIRSLLEFKKFKEAAARLGTRQEAQMRLFSRTPPVPEPERERPLAEVSVLDLLNAFGRILRRIAQREVKEIFEEHYTVSEKIEALQKRLGESEGPIRFGEMFEQAASRTEVVVIFLALLELIRLRQVRAVQKEAFGEIWLRREPAPQAQEAAQAE